MKEWSCASCIMWTTMPRNDITLGDVHPSKPRCSFPGYFFRVFQYSCFNLGGKRKQTWRTFPTHSLETPWISLISCEIVASDGDSTFPYSILKMHWRGIFDDGEWMMALNNPKGNEVLKFGLAVGRPMCVLCNAFWVFNHLTFTWLDMTEEVGCGILLAFLREDDGRVSKLQNVRLSVREKNGHAHLANKLILNFPLLLDDYQWFEMFVTIWSPILHL